MQVQLYNAELCVTKMHINTVCTIYISSLGGLLTAGVIINCHSDQLCRVLTTWILLIEIVNDAVARSFNCKLQVFILALKS